MHYAISSFAPIPAAFSSDGIFECVYGHYCVLSFHIQAKSKMLEGKRDRRGTILNPNGAPLEVRCTFEGSLIFA